ncbi:MAG: epoxyqueuosine reductase QueH [Eubacteriaceae bacterium]|jgi:predicted adenine nucleotide alpha hydrolase (AANH) superfamily ATPase|nr:epoxyqueuosine reductase QueH [Eubacteriaceae bacterium]MDD4508434.1 epoxyqueuosine reductase QueH [Eubacteriaceae bacterium]
MKVNYQKELEAITGKLEGSGKRPRVMLHSCCGPCSSYVLTYLTAWFDLTVFFYNPNIYPESEYIKRRDEQIRLIACLNDAGLAIDFLRGDAPHDHFLEIAKGFETARERGKRCHRCYAFRLHKTAEMAKVQHCDYFATTLTVSPHKDAQVINPIGKAIGMETGVSYLPSDFKKKNGYLKSIELSKRYHLYRQNYCGCEFAMGHLQKECV